MTFLERFSPQLLSALRIMSGLLFLAHGTAKHLNFPPNDRFTDLDPVSLPAIAGYIEIVFGLLVTAGYYTRVSAFICSGLGAAAYFIGHAPRGFYPVLNGGDAAILFCFVFLYIAAAGPGPYAINQK